MQAHPPSGPRPTLHVPALPDARLLFHRRADHVHVGRRALARETDGGIALLAVTVIALTIASAPLRDAYEAFRTALGAGVQGGSPQAASPLRCGVNELSTALLFVVVGLEIRRALGTFPSLRSATRRLSAALAPPEGPSTSRAALAAPAPSITQEPT